jgi:toxin FitB
MILLDTNVISELMRPAPSARVLDWVNQQPGPEIYTSTITEMEIFFGIEILPKGKRRDDLLSAAESVFTHEFADRVFSFDGNAARISAQIAAHRRILGRPMNHADAQIAAIAQEHEARLATRNVDDFRDCGIEIVDPWSD